MRFGWFSRRPGRRRPASADRRRAGGTTLAVRRLERRRVLNASITSLVVPTVAAEGDTLAASATATGVGSLFFDWSLRQGPTQFDGGSGSNLTTFTFTLPDNGTYELRLRVFDAVQGTDSRTVSIVVTNVDPSIDLLAITTPIHENDFATLTGTYSDPGLLDTHELDIDWNGDGVFDETVAVSGGTFSINRQFLDDEPSGTPVATFDVNVRLRDNDGGLDTGSVGLTVLNVSPVLTVVGDQTVDEGTLLDLSGGDGAPNLGTFTDVGTLDTHTATIDWGDGTIQPATIVQFSGSGLVQGSHTYADNGIYTVTVKLVDDDTGSDTRSFTVTVNNVAPTLDVVGPQTVDEGAELSIPNLATITDPGFRHDPLGTDETFTFWINWGDGTPADTGSAVIDVVGSPGILTEASFGGSHVYADDGVYTVVVRVADDDMTADFTGGVAGIDFVEQSFTVTVNNVDPTLTGTDGLEVDEGQAFTLSGLGVGISDPGFDNPANPLAPPHGSLETFEVLAIDWGDGTAPVAASVVNRVSGSVAVPTTAQLDHAAHTYADDGVYTVQITLKDDDGDWVTRDFVVRVNNVVPTLTLTDQSFVINEGTLLEIPSLARLTDPGFDNPNNPLSAPGGSVEVFRYWIDWGDGTAPHTGDATIGVIGSPGVLTVASFGGSHFYADNSPDNLYTITVRVADDDMAAYQTPELFTTGVAGADFVEQSFQITVYNVNPVLLPITATDLDSRGITTLRLTFFDLGADVYEILVDWGDKLHEPNPDNRFVVERTAAGAGTHSFTIVHRYTAPPDPLNPTADITIRVKIHDDDARTVGVIEPGISNVQSARIRNPGIGDNNVAIDTTPQVPRLELSPPLATDVFFGEQNGSAQGLQTADVRVAGGELAATAERYLELRVVYPDGTESEGYRLKDEVLHDLRGLFATLPDGQYKIFLVRTENNSQRLVVEVSVRNGRVIDTSDDSDGTRDRPPTSEDAEQLALPLEEHPWLEREGDEVGDGSPAAVDGSATHGALPTIDPVPPSVWSLRYGAPLAGLTLATWRSRDRWSQRVEKALSAADVRSWQRLRHAARSGRAGRRGLGAGK